MDKDEARRFVNDVHIGDYLKVQYDAGFLWGLFGDRNREHTGYVSGLHANSVALDSDDPFESPMTGTRKPLGYDQITGYKKVEPNIIIDMVPKTE